MTKAELDEWCKTIAPSTELARGITTTRNVSLSSPAATTTNRPNPKQAEALAHLRILARTETSPLLTASRPSTSSEATVPRC